MAFSHIQGIATSINNWFSIFENWITANCGWIVQSGSGTQNLVLRSAGEGGAYTKLFCNVWKDGANPTRVRAEVQDDAAGTHKTTGGYYADGGTEQFYYFMSGDKDSFVYSFKLLNAHRTVYVGIIEPYAAAPPDETYYMIVSNGVNQAKILRNQAGLWDQASTLQIPSQIQTADKNRLDWSLPIGGLYFNTGVNIAGQCKHISGELKALGVAAEDTLRSCLPGGNSEWIVLNDQSGRKFALRTGGTLPVGFTDGAHIAFAAGVSANYAAFEASLCAFLTVVGWNVPGGPGGGSTTCFSTGESGLDLIRVHVLTNAAGTEIWAEDWTHVHESAHYRNTCRNPLDYPAPYWFAADLDFMMIIQTGSGAKERPIYAGKFPLAQQALSNTYYEIIAGCGPTGAGTAQASTLLGLNGVWGSGCTFEREAQAAGNSSPNAYDGVTYVVFPYYVYITALEWLGVIKYIHHCQSAAIARHDTVTIGARVYHIFQDATLGYYAVRTA